jgi:glucose/arabinose dehydrogenase
MRDPARRTLLVPIAILAILLLAGCFPFLPSRGGGQTTFTPPRIVDASDVALPPGYTIEAVATGLTFPTGVAFDAAGRVHVVEAGYAYGEVVTVPRLLRLDDDGRTSVVATGDNPPWNGVDFADGAFFVAGGTLHGGQLLRIDADGSVAAIVDGLPGLGDHHPNGPVAGHDGYLYFGQGTATNAAVVGLDNADFGWLARYPDFHDVPCDDVVLAGRNFRTADPLGGAPSVVTGAYVPFGTPTEPGQVVAGAVPCSGAVMRVRPDGADLELVAWGFRNPFGLAIAGDGTLFVTDNQYDVRGSRPVFGAGDLLWRVVPGTWYGWPDYHGDWPLSDADHFRPPGEPAPGFLLQAHPGIPPAPAARLGVHSSSNGLDVARSEAFGYVGDAFIAQFGDMAPAVGKVLGPVGFRVVRVDPASGVVHDFAVNRAEAGGPASRLGSGGLERPVAVRFDPTGEALYVVDFGVMTVGEGPQPQPGTGVLWRIERRDRP